MRTSPFVALAMAFALSGCASESPDDPSNIATGFRPLDGGRPFGEWALQRRADSCVDVLDAEGNPVLTTLRWCDTPGTELSGTPDLALLGTDSIGGVYFWTDAAIDLVTIEAEGEAMMSDTAQILVVYPAGGETFTVNIGQVRQCEVRVDDGAIRAACEATTPPFPGIVPG